AFCPFVFIHKTFKLLVLQWQKAKGDVDMDEKSNKELAVDVAKAYIVAHQNTGDTPKLDVNTICQVITEVYSTLQTLPGEAV
ncbi:MAG: hypothetical protein RSB35_08510, partial [Eubacterium sp.]